MSKEFPIIAITGSSGSGSSTVTSAFEHIFWRERVKAAYIQGNAFHRYGRKEMKQKTKEAKKEGEILSHFGPDANHLDKLETLFFQYGNTGTGLYRHYLHTEKVAEMFNQKVGTLTPWTEMDPDTDLLLYRGLHGAVKAGDINIARYSDLRIGIVPNINLEWIRKIKRDTSMKGYSLKAVRKSILHRMRDYVEYITPQFSRTHINIQMVPTIDTSDPFTMKEEPTLDECLLVINFQNGVNPDLPELIEHLPGSFVSRRNTLVVPGSKMTEAIEVALMPLVHDLVTKSRKLRNISDVPKSRGAGILGRLGQSHM